MKKNSTTNLINTINETIAIARDRGIVHLFTEDERLNGRHITVHGQKLLNFGSCSYLGLEMDERLIEASVAAVRRYGTQFSSSRTYVSFTLYEELEKLMGNIYGTPVILSSSTSLGHQSVIPIVVEDGDAVIVDHQAHVSMRDALPRLQVRGVTTTLVRHSRLDELEKKIAELSPKHERIWYFLDGVYSMYGDLAPIEELVQLLDKHRQLYLYIDDAHGMSWAGANGMGYVLSKVPLHRKMVYSTSLAKGFASAGGVFVIQDQELYWRVRQWGGPLTYSGPQQPAVVAASVASAKIHLSGEIQERQQKLATLIDYCNQRLEACGLPVIAPSVSPIFFVGQGLTRVGYNMVRRLMNDGLFVNLGIFPAVPETCTGIRFTLTLHHTFADIDRLAERLAYHLPQALQEEGRTTDDIYRAFRSIYRSRENDRHEGLEKTPALVEIQQTRLALHHYTTILDINKPLWDGLLGSNGCFDWNSLALLEDSFRDNERPEDNWDFHYYLITNQAGKPVVATFFTVTLAKDDMLSPAGVSMKIEEQRKDDFYYLTSRSMIMGTLITEGEHLYLDRSHPEWRKALMMLLDTVWAEQDKQKVNGIYLRDFPADDLQMRDFFIDQGFVKTDLPYSHVIYNPPYESFEMYLAHLSSKRRKHVRQDALDKADWFEVKETEQASPAELDRLYALYESVHKRSLEINTFKLPKKFFENIILSPHWEVTTLTLKPQYDFLGKEAPVGVGFAYKNVNYSPAIVGYDYDYRDTAKVYKQIILQIVKRALHLKSGKIYCGFTASLEKRKFGAIIRPQVAYVQMKDNFDMSQLYMQSSV